MALKSREFPHYLTKLFSNIANMKWQFEINYNYKRVIITAEIVYTSAQIEKIKLTAGTHEMLIESNRPLLQAKGLNKKRIQWKVREGSINNASAFEMMIESIEAYLRNQGKKPYVHPKNF